MTDEITLQTLPLDAIRLDPRNPRTDGDESDLDELAASIRAGGVVQPPTVILEGDGCYRVLLGERRVRAARLAGLEAIPCLVRPVSGETEAHCLRVIENLHRQALNPIDQAAALRLAWLLANARALGVEDEAEALLAEPRPPVAALPEIEALLAAHGFKPTAPPVTWDQVLDGMGVAMSPSRRKKLLRVLAIPQDVQETLRRTPVTEAAVRAIGTLNEDAQRQIAAAIAEEPDLARRARRIARAIRDQGYSVEEALAEARGEWLAADEAPEPHADAPLEPAYANDQAITEAVMAFMDAANALMAALHTLRELAPDVLDIPDPWRGFYQNALTTLQEEL